MNLRRNTLGRWTRSVFAIVAGSVLWMLGLGDVYRCVECARCGREVEDSDEAFDRHIAFFHKDEADCE